MKEHYVTVCIQTKLSKEMNVKSRKENNTHLTETLHKAKVIKWENDDEYC